MSLKDLLCLSVAIVGTILFLYGSNFYDAVLGWIGLLMLVAAIAAEIVLEAYKYIIHNI